MFAQKEGLTVLCISFLVYKSIQPIRSRLSINQSNSVSSKLNKTDVPNWKYLDNLWNEERYIFKKKILNFFVKDISDCNAYIQYKRTQKYVSTSSN